MDNSQFYGFWTGRLLGLVHEISGSGEPAEKIRAKCQKVLQEYEEARKRNE